MAKTYLPSPSSELHLVFLLCSRGRGTPTSHFLEGHAHQCQKFVALGVVPGRGDNADVHAPLLVNAFKPNFGEHTNLWQAQGVVAFAIKTVGVDALEIPGSGQCQVHKPVQESIHHLHREVESNKQ